jgi:hypothetical protein
MLEADRPLGGPRPAWKNSVRWVPEEAGGECVVWCSLAQDRVECWRPSACEGKLAVTVHLPLFSRGLSVSTKLIRQASKSGSLFWHTFT